MSFTTSALVKRRLRIPAGVTTQDALISDIVDEINDAVVDATGQEGLAGGTFSEQVSIFDRGVTSRGFENFPWTSVVAMTLDTRVLTEDDDFVVELDIGYIHLKSGLEFPIGEGKTQITYVSKDMSAVAQGRGLQRAATNWAVAEVNRAPHHGFKTEQQGRYKYNLDEEDMPASVRTALARYCKIFQL